ncbi:radical SAM protein [Aquiflexum sp.]|uniref:B12-binding domain-containing radical SAM protein n=1 Tax=Aquiflexum sp. TaxID=1872584 RepID=UPI0035941233
MRVLLIGPTALDYNGLPIKQNRLHLPGLTLPMLAAVTPPDVELRLVSETVEDIPFDEPWDLVGLTGMGSGIFRAWQIADEFRKRKIKVVMGGIAASLCDPDWTLAHVDCLVTGEAEDIWPIVIEDFRNGRLKQRYDMQHRPDINMLPVPRYDLMNRKKLGFWRPVQATRGCPFPCTFCSIQSYFERTYRKRPVDQVIRDVRAAKKSGTHFIAFIDDNIGVDWKYFEELMTALIPEKIIWMSQCSIHIADKPAMLALAYKSGCRLLSFGIESTNPESLALIEKDFNKPANYETSLRAIRKAGIDVSTEMIIGMDSDKPDVFQNTYEFIIQNRISVPRVHILTPVPGTPLYQEMRAEGRILHDDFSQYSGGRVVFRPKNIDTHDLQKNYWKLYEQLFTRVNILKRISGSPYSQGPYMRAVVLAINLHYRNHIKQKITPGIV